MTVIMHNKLVRDKIPEIIESNNEVAVTRVLSDEEFIKELLRKLDEECLEVKGASSSEELLKELADVIEVVKALAEINGKSLEDVINLANKKREERGGFAKKIYLVKTYNT